MGEDDYVKRMADALRSGAKMLSEQCPVCGSPLFEIRGELRCLKCDKRVVKVRADEEVEMTLTAYGLTQTSTVLATKVEELTVLLSRTTDPEEIRKLSETLEIVLKTLEQTLKIQQLLKQREKT